MTLNTECALATERGVILVIAPLGGMTTATGHHLPGAGIEYIGADRMTEGCMVTMTVTTDLIDRPTHHRRMVGAMGGMAIAATLGAFMAEGGILMADKGRLMAFTADMTLLAFEQALIITGMGRMTGGTAIGSVAHQMVVRRGHLLCHLRVTAEAGIHSHRLTANVAIAAARCIGSMQLVTNQPRALTAVRVMARTAVGRWRRKTGVFAHYLSRPMTGQAQLIGRLDQQVRMV